MLASIQSFIRSAVEPPAAGTADTTAGRRLAAAALLVEVAAADFESRPEERDAVGRALREVFELPAESVDQLIEEAEREHDRTTSLFKFTRVLNENCSTGERFEILTNMWRVAFADGELDKYEDHRIRRLAELLNLSHRQFMMAKHRAQEQEKG
jgi:uncharacterized tellurite resistance protein B-like protein